MGFAKSDHRACKVQKPLRSFIEVPVVPTDLVVLAVCIVVTALAATDFVSSTYHWHALRQQQRGRQIALLSLARRKNRRVVAWPLGAHIPGVVIVRTVLIIFTIRCIVLLVVADEVLESEPIVCGDEIDTRVRTPAVVLVEIAAAGEAVGEVRQLAFVPLPVAAHRITIFAIPLRPQHREIAHLISPVTDVPWFCNELDLRNNRVL